MLWPTIYDQRAPTGNKMLPVYSSINMQPMLHKSQLLFHPDSAITNLFNIQNTYTTRYTAHPQHNHNTHSTSTTQHMYSTLYAVCSINAHTDCIKQMRPIRSTARTYITSGALYCLVWTMLVCFFPRVVRRVPPKSITFTCLQSRVFVSRSTFGVFKSV